MRNVFLRANKIMSIGFLFIFLYNASVAQDFSKSGSLTPGLNESQKEKSSPVTFRAQGRKSADRLEISLILDIKKGAEVYFDKDHFFLISQSSLGLEDVKVVYPDYKTKDNDGGNVSKTFEGLSVIKIIKKIKAEPWEIKGSIRYQSCMGAVCYPPETKPFRFQSGVYKDQKTEAGKSVEKSGKIYTNIEGREHFSKTSETNGLLDKTGKGNDAKNLYDTFQDQMSRYKIVKRAAGYMKAPDFTKFLNLEEFQNVNADKSGVKNGNPDGGLFENKNLWIVLIMIVVGGLALNFTPCVLPLIPVNLAIIGAGSAGAGGRKGFLLGSVYGAGMALSYGISGLIVAVTGKAFGAVNASPVFNIVIAVFFVILALAMFDVIVIDFSKLRQSRGMSETASKSGVAKWISVFFMGALSAVLAGACVAPVLISVLLYASSQYAAGNFFALGLPFLLGLGMALPWPLAGAGISFLPKPGLWMNKLKWVMGVLILAVGIYYAHTAVKLLRDKNVGKNGSVSESYEEKSSGVKELSRFLSVLKDAPAGKPVVVDFWATWCKNCKVMDQTTFKDPQVNKILKENFVFLKYKAENPDAGITKKVLKHFDVIGLPTYIILKPVK